MTFLYIIAALLASLVILAAWRTASFRSGNPDHRPYDAGAVDGEKAARSLSGALQIKTVSNEDYAKTDFAQFNSFLTYLERTFPGVYAGLEHEMVNTYSPLFRWKGSDPLKKPVLLMAHYDVVPADPDSEASWTYPPFSGTIEAGTIWGRGALDIKCQVIGILEAVESLLKEGYQPQRDIYITFGHDEEVDGQQGARVTAELLKQRGMDFEFVLDEGSHISESILPGIQKPLALIGLCEKGYADVKLLSESRGGHSSTPEADTALSIVCEGVARLHKHPFRSRITPPVKWFLDAVGPEMPLPGRIALANQWLFGRAIVRRLSKIPSGNALFRTTTAATMAGGSLQANILPQKAWAVINFRLLNGETRKDLENHIRKVLRGLDIKTEFLISNDPSAVSQRHSDAYRAVEKTVLQIFPDVLPAPYIMTGASDSIKYEKVSRNIFRFSPYRMNSADAGKVHGNNECISVRNMEDMVRFYKQLIRNV
jgi:carboxypeptidase PM20D1